MWRTPLGDGAVMSGQPTVLADGVLIRQGIGMMPVSATSNVLLYRAENQETRTRLAWFDRKSLEGAALTLQRHCRNAEFSPDYSRVPIECWESSGGRDIWVYDLARDAAARPTSDPGRTIYWIGAGVKDSHSPRPGLARLAGIAPDGRFLIAKVRAWEIPRVQVVVSWK
jgi:hypothetical protein